MTRQAFVRVTKYGERIDVICYAHGLTEQYSRYKDGEAAAKLHNRLYHPEAVTDTAA